MPNTLIAESQAVHARLESLVSTILDTIVDGVITIDGRGLIQSYNKACESLFGYNSAEVLGKNISMLMPDPYHGEHDRYLENYKQTGTAKIIGIGREVTGKRKDNSTFPMELSVGATNQGGEHAFVGIIRNITERHEAQKQREQLQQGQKMEAIGQLTAGVAHDFNNLLAIILGNLDIVSEKLASDHPFQKYLAPCITASEHGAELIHQLLAFARKQTLQPDVLDLNELILYLSKWISRTLGERIEVITHFEENVWPICADHAQLQNALINLAVNARDAMPKGGKLIFETRNLAYDPTFTEKGIDFAPVDHVVLSVSDTGEGMPPEVIEKAFDPFFSTKGIGKGTGLGLSMVYGFVKQSAGHIKIYSELGFGTRITIYLPTSAQPLETKTAQATQQIAAPVAQKTILVVEDNADVLDMTSQMIMNIGYKMIACISGEEALEILRTDKKIDMLLSDVILAGALNGPDVAKLALKLRPNLKVLFNSGYAEQSALSTGLLPEDVMLISKPFRQSQLASKIRDVFNQKTCPQERTQWPCIQEEEAI